MAIKECCPALSLHPARPAKTSQTSKKYLLSNSASMVSQMLLLVLATAACISAYPHGDKLAKDLSLLLNQLEQLEVCILEWDYNFVHSFLLCMQSAKAQQMQCPATPPIRVPLFGIHEFRVCTGKASMLCACYDNFHFVQWWDSGVCLLAFQCALQIPHLLVATPLIGLQTSNFVQHVSLDADLTLLACWSCDSAPLQIYSFWQGLHQRSKSDDLWW